MRNISMIVDRKVAAENRKRSDGLGRRQRHVIVEIQYCTLQVDC